MKTMIGLLRGINVGGKNKIKMAELRDSLQAAGLIDVTTYIQSGNLVFRSNVSAKRNEDLVRNAIQTRFGYDVPVLVREKTFFRRLFENNPFVDRTITSLSAVVLADRVKPTAIKAIDPAGFGEDEFSVAGDVVYLFLPNGSAKTKLTNGFFEKKFSTTATSRNWKTITKLIELSAQ